jgi:predicted PurR-regulated permease PerM
MLWAVDNTDEFKSRARYIIFLAISAVLALLVLWTARVILLLLFAAILGALLLATVTDWARATLKLSRPAALILVLVAGAASAGVGIWLRGAAIAEQFSDLQTTLPMAAHKLHAQLQVTAWGRWLFAHFSDGGQQAGGIAFALSRIGGILLSSAAIVTGAVLIGMASIYFAAEPESYLRGLRLLTPPRYHDTLERGLTGAASQLRRWLLAKLLSMIAVGLLISTGLWIVRIPLAGTLGVIAACLTFIPNLGPILSAVPAGLLAFAISPTKGLLTIFVFFLVHFIEGNFLTPLAERGIVNLPPGLTLFAQLLLASVAGPLGIALAAPLTAAVSGAVLALRPAPENCDNLSELAPVPFTPEPVRHGH